jgi:transposase InsO family protein
MPWRMESMQLQKKKFITLWETGRFTKTYLCEEFRISRPTGDAIIQRYQEVGWDALEEQSRGHKSHPLTTAKNIEDAIVNERKEHSNWGGKKIRVLLLRTYDASEIPSETTVNNILKKHGLTVPRKPPRRKILNSEPKFDPQIANQIMSADFKGKFRMGNGHYCNPLTIADSYSRFLFAIEGLERPNTESSKPIFEKVFREYGLPYQLHTDNGPPFGNPVSLRRMTMLSVWIMEIGITPVYSDPASPQQNGRHERMHRDLKADATRPPGSSMVAQQRKFNHFREEYNTIRPHEALLMKTPAEVHTWSSREYPRRIRDWDYEKDITPKMVTVNGAIRWKDKGFAMISTALGGKYVGLSAVDDGLWLVYYRHVALGYFCERTMKVHDLNDFDF